MARTRVVTRTINAIEVTVKTVNPESENFETIKVTVTGDVSQKLVDKAIAKECTSRGLVPMKVIGTQRFERVYGMLETEFLKLARPMDELRHFVEDDTDTDTE